MPAKKTASAVTLPSEAATAEPIRACGYCGRIEGTFGDCGSVVTCPMLNGQEPRVLGPQDAVVACSVEGCGFRRAVSATQTMRDIRIHDAGCQRSQEGCGAYFETIGTSEATAATPGGAVDGAQHVGG